MNIIKKLLSLQAALSIILVSGVVFAKDKAQAKTSDQYLAAGTSSECPPSGCPVPKKDPGENGDEDYEYEYEEYEQRPYKRMYYTFGLCGSYFVDKADIDIDSVIGAFTHIEFRFARYVGVSFDSYYGWVAGKGNQYLSAFNPGVKIYPAGYKNPKFEPFIMIGGQVFDSIFGDSSLGKIGMAQGGFAGVGFKMMPEGMPLGFEFFTRASFLYMQKPSSAGGGRGIAIPVFAFIGATY